LGTPGYVADSVRQKFTGYESDAETGLNYAQARYQSNIQGRFTSIDPLGASARIENPQSFNRYSYVGNSPLNNVDPSGLMLSDIGVYQTGNPETASKLENEMARRFRVIITPDPPMGGVGSVLGTQQNGPSSISQGSTTEGSANQNPYRTDWLTLRLDQLVRESVPNPFEEYAQTQRGAATTLEMANAEFNDCTSSARVASLYNLTQYQKDVHFRSTIDLRWTVGEGFIVMLVTKNVGGFAGGVALDIGLRTLYDSNNYDNDLFRGEARARVDYQQGLLGCIRAVGQKYGIWFVPRDASPPDRILFEPRMERPTVIRFQNLSTATWRL
jgi:RHS repeat-associated protein